jgi:hypothetical protein
MGDNALALGPLAFTHTAHSHHFEVALPGVVGLVALEGLLRLSFPFYRS